MTFFHVLREHNFEVDTFANEGTILKFWVLRVNGTLSNQVVPQEINTPSDKYHSANVTHVDHKASHFSKLGHKHNETHTPFTHAQLGVEFCF